DPGRRAAAELMLEGGELVVEGGRGGDAEPAGSQRQLVRAVRERDVDPTVFRPASQRAEPDRHLPRLLEARAAAAAADHLRPEPVQLEQLERLRVLAGGDLDVVAALAHELDQRPEHEHVRARGHVYPDSHGLAPSDTASPGMPWCPTPGSPRVSGTWFRKCHGELARGARARVS